jgi:hypothetical protein
MAVSQRNVSSSDGEWISLMDYAMRSGVSLSTLRRHIKANKLVYRVENGRYLLLNPDSCTDHSAVTEDQQDALLTKAELQRAREEISELRMLIALYEEKLPHAGLDC